MTTTTNYSTYETTFLGCGLLAIRNGERWLMLIRDRIDPKLSRVRLSMDWTQLDQLANAFEAANDYLRGNASGGYRSWTAYIGDDRAPVSIASIPYDRAMLAEVGPFTIDIEPRQVPDAIRTLRRLRDMLSPD